MLVTILLSMLSVPVSLQTQPKTMTVCDVMAHLKDLDGQIIIIEGALAPLATGMFPDALSPTPSQSCKAPGTQIPAQIQIEEPDSHFLSNPPPGFKMDVASVVSTERTMMDAVNKNPSQQVRFSVVVEGVLVVTAYGPPARGRGYPHPWYPAHLIIQSYKRLLPQ